uniref:Putative HNH endonuclease n=1 Tax=viral metagenome TaxID=1070528 RepID=A0A6M3JZH6_9ZZZZ
MNQTTKVCPQCKEEKDISEFTFSTGREHSWCRPCRNSQKRAWALCNPDKVQAQHKCYYKNNRQYAKQRAQDYRVKLKYTVLEHYSRGEPKCAVCGEKDIIVLCIDHINGHGQEHRRQIGRTSGSAFYNWLIINGFPKGFQVLCFNCNMRKRFNNQEFG